MAPKSIITMIDVYNKINCCGCSACAQICPKQCISMIQDKEGFLYPLVNKTLCIDCHKCEKVCPIANQSPKEATISRVFSAYALDENIRIKSSSGGIFSLLAENIIEKNGVVAGAAYDDEWNVAHRIIDKKEDVISLIGSKYSQSIISNCFKLLEQLLDMDKYVLFVGTPCQVEGLRHYLNKKNYRKLILIDFICHGVPSPKVWNMYKQELCTKYGSTISFINFRDKSHGWKGYHLSIKFDNGKHYSKLFTWDKFIQTFIRNISIRPCCYDCKFKGIERHSDITLGDFWGIKKINKKMDDNKGTSMIIIHSSKGMQLLDQLKKYTIINEENLDYVSQLNPSCIYSCKKPINRNPFFNNIESYSFSFLYNKYVRYKKNKELKNNIKGLLKLIFKL